MKQEALFKKLGIILNELNEQYDFLAQNPEQLSELELELFLANASFLTDHLQIIKKLNLPTIAPSPVEKPTDAADTLFIEAVGEKTGEKQEIPAVAITAPQEIFNDIEPEPTIEKVDVFVPTVQVEEPLVEETEREIFRLDPDADQTFEFILNKDAFTENDRFDFEEKTAEQLFDRPLSKEEELILEQKKKVKENLIRNPEDLEEDEDGPEPFLVTHSEEKQEIQAPIAEPSNAPVPEEPTSAAVAIKTTVIETTSVEVETTYKPTLNDLLAGKNASTRLNESSSPIVTDLKAAINLNDKLLYIKDLFNGYNLAYAEAIDIANKMPNFDAADNFFQKNYAIKNNWADKQATVDKFYLLLNRRFKD